MDSLPKEKKLKRTLKYDCDFLSVYEDDVLLPGGKKSKRVVVEHIGAAAILPITSDNEVILVRQYRYAADTESLEIPAGKKDVIGEDPVLCAKRELTEETGYSAEDIVKIAQIYSAIGFSDEKIDIFVAYDVEKTGEVDTDPDEEFVEVVKMPLGEAIQMARRGLIRDAKTVVALLSMQ